MNGNEIKALTGDQIAKMTPKQLRKVLSSAVNWLTVCDAANDKYRERLKEYEARIADPDGKCITLEGDWRAPERVHRTNAVVKLKFSERDSLTVRMTEYGAEIASESWGGSHGSTGSIIASPIAGNVVSIMTANQYERNMVASFKRHEAAVQKRIDDLKSIAKQINEIDADKLPSELRWKLNRVKTSSL